MELCIEKVLVGKGCGPGICWTSRMGRGGGGGCREGFEGGGGGRGSREMFVVD